MDKSPVLAVKIILSILSGTSYFKMENWLPGFQFSCTMSASMRFCLLLLVLPQLLFWVEIFFNYCGQVVDFVYYFLISGQREIERQLSRDDIGNQARYLLTQFIHDRLEENGMRDAPAAEVLIDPGTPTGNHYNPHY